MDFKRQIEKNYERCVETLDAFGEEEIRAIYRFISIINQQSLTYELSDEVNRLAIFDYLFSLKYNKNGYSEYMISERFFTLLYVMSGMVFLQGEYRKKIKAEK